MLISIKNNWCLHLHTATYARVVVLLSRYILVFLCLSTFRKGNKKLAEETSPYLNLLKDGKNSEEAAVAQSASNSGSHDGNLDTTEPNRDGEVLDSNETADKDDGHAIKNGTNIIA